MQVNETRDLRFAALEERDEIRDVID